MSDKDYESPLPMTPELLSALAALHDLQIYNEGVAVFPVERSLLVLVISFFFISIAYALWWRSPRQRILRRLAYLKMMHGGESGKSGKNIELAAGVAHLAELLRGAAKTSSKMAMPAGLSGDAWLIWLDAHAPAGDRGAFAQGIGRELLIWPYASASHQVPDPDRVNALFGLASRWLKANV